MTTRAQRAAMLQPAPSTISEARRVSFTETDWNWHWRTALHIQGYRAFHIREASEVGVSDLIVYRNQGPMGSKPCAESCETCVQVIESWLELKVQRRGEKLVDLVNPGQKEFLRNHWRIGRNALVAAYVQHTDMIEVRQGDLKGRVKTYVADPYLIEWQEVFAHFKARKVSL